MKISVLSIGDMVRGSTLLWLVDHIYNFLNVKI